MNGFIFRVCAYHGEPVVMNGSGVRARSGIGVDTVVPGDKVVNDPNNAIIKDMAKAGRECEYDLGALVEDFQTEYGCKVNYDFDIVQQDNDLHVFQLDVFEPSWSDEDEAKDVVDDLSERLLDWAEGFPRGR